MSRKFLFAAAAVLALAAPAPARAERVSDADRSFLTDAMKGDNSEIALGQLAMKRAASRTARAFGRTLVNDHQSAKNQVAALDRKLGVRPTNKLMSEAEEEKSKLMRLHGADFDREFASYMVQDHKTDIDKFQSEADSGKGAVPRLARKTLPTLRKHLEIAQKLNG